MNILLVLGGAYHDFDGFASGITPTLDKEGFSVNVTYDFTALERLESLDIDVVMLYTVLGNANDGKRIGKDFSPAQIAALAAWVEQGNGLVGIHGATISEKTNVAHQQLIGGHFQMHPPQMQFTVVPRYAPHPIISGINAFEVFDELYMHGMISDGEILATATHDNQMHPMLWIRHHGKGKIAYFAPGHDAGVWQVKQFQQLVVRCVEWVKPA